MLWITNSLFKFFYLKVTQLPRLYSIGRMVLTRELNYSEKTSFQCHWVHHRFIMDWSEIGSRPLEWEARACNNSRLYFLFPDLQKCKWQVLEKCLNYITWRNYLQIPIEKYITVNSNCEEETWLLKCKINWEIMWYFDMQSNFHAFTVHTTHT